MKPSEKMFVATGIVAIVWFVCLIVGFWCIPNDPPMLLVKIGLTAFAIDAVLVCMAMSAEQAGR